MILKFLGWLLLRTVLVSLGLLIVAQCTDYTFSIFRTPIMAALVSLPFVFLIDMNTRKTV
jgi:hypothetical protein